MIPQRCAFIDLPRDGWRWSHNTRMDPNTTWSKLLRHAKNPEILLQVNQVGRELTISKVVGTNGLGEPIRDAFVFLPAPSKDPLTKTGFWSCLDRMHGPRDWPRIEALFRMSDRWILQAGAVGHWNLTAWGTQLLLNPIGREDPASQDFAALKAMEDRILPVLRQTAGLLRPSHQTYWTADPKADGGLPASGHARIARHQELLLHAHADAALFGLDPSDTDI